jgi:hypothetical protein
VADEQITPSVVRTVDGEPPQFLIAGSLGPMLHIPYVRCPAHGSSAGCTQPSFRLCSAKTPKIHETVDKHWNMKAQLNAPVLGSTCSFAANCAKVRSWTSRSVQRRSL